MFYDIVLGSCHYVMLCFVMGSVVLLFLVLVCKREESMSECKG
jgi:hypothetical protein